MRIRWTLLATQDLEALDDYISREDPVAAARTALRVLDAIERLVQHPGQGRPGRVPGTRELVIPTLPYIVAYRVDMAETLVVLRVLHAAMKWPEKL